MLFRSEAGRKAEVDEAEGGDVVLPAGAVHAAVLLPQHARGVDHRAKVDGRGDVGCGGGDINTRLIRGIVFTCVDLHCLYTTTGWCCVSSFGVCFTVVD